LFIVLFSSVEAIKKSKQISAATWNVGLFSWLDPTAVIAALPTTYDVLALEEVWSRTVALEIASIMSSTHPYSVIPPQFQGPDIGCLATNPYCVYLGLPSNCSIFLAEASINCLQSSNMSTSTVWIENVPPGSCLDILEILLAVDGVCAACINNELHQLPDGPDAYQAVRTCAQWQGRTYDFDGFPGLVLLSKNPITSISIVDMVSFVTRRAIIFAKIDEVLYSSSHYSWNLGIPAPFVSPVFDSQVVFAQKQIDSRADVVLADFNSGPDYQSAAFYLLLANYTLLTGYVETYCPPPLSTTIICTVQPEPPSQIDHVFVRKTNKVRKSSSTLFNAVPGLSDHVGIAAIATIQKPFPRNPNRQKKIIR